MTFPWQVLEWTGLALEVVEGPQNSRVPVSNSSVSLLPWRLGYCPTLEYAKKAACLAGFFAACLPVVPSEAAPEKQLALQGGLV